MYMYFIMVSLLRDISNYQKLCTRFLHSLEISVQRNSRNIHVYKVFVLYPERFLSDYYRIATESYEIFPYIANPSTIIHVQVLTCPVLTDSFTIRLVLSEGSLSISTPLMEVCCLLPLEDIFWKLMLLLKHNNDNKTITTTTIKTTIATTSITIVQYCNGTSIITVSWMLRPCT